MSLPILYDIAGALKPFHARQGEASLVAHALPDQQLERAQQHPAWAGQLVDDGEVVAARNADRRSREALPGSSPCELDRLALQFWQLGCSIGYEHRGCANGEVA